MALHFNASVGHARAQFLFLLVGVITVTGGGRTHHRRTDQGTFAAVVVTDGGTGQCAGECTEAAVFGGFAHALRATVGLALIVIRVRRGAAGQQGHGSSDNNQTTRGEHGELLLFLHSVVQRPLSNGPVRALDHDNAQKFRGALVTKYSGAHKRVFAHFITQTRIRPVTGHHGRVLVQRI
ncbi:hypothetical protein D3C81_1322210 [compost metagenome]